MLTGNLVRLRPLTMADLDRCFAWVNDAEVTQYLNVRYAYSYAAEEEWLKKAVYQTSPPEVTLAIETLADGCHIGNVGLHNVEAENRKAGFSIMIGNKDFWSRGYGTDATLTVLRFAFDEMNLNRVYLTVLTDNLRAIACYRKCAFVEEGVLREDHYQGGRHRDLMIMAVLADDFRALHPVSL